MPPDDYPERPSPPREAAIPRDIRKALDHMRRSRGEPVTVAELAAACGVPERTLRKHFRRFVGLSPLAHLRRLRLAAARADLLACEGTLSVTEIATRHGFAHLGRFASDYARHFGEPPSATLNRGRREAEEREQDRRREEWRREEAARALAEAGNGGAHRPHLGRHAAALLIAPFEVAPGHEDAQFAADLAADLAATLSRVHGFPVILAPRPPAGTHDWRHDARRSTANYCLAGRIANGGERMRVVVQLLDTTTGAHLWGDCYDGLVRDRPALLDRITALVPDSVAASVRENATARAERRPPGSSNAGDLVLRAVPMLLAGDRTSVARVIELMDHAMALDPDHAQAPALGAYAHAVLFNHLVFAGESASSAMAAKRREHELARRATALDSVGDPLVLLAHSCIVRGQGDREQSEAIVARAVAIDPAASLAWGQSAWWKNGRRNTDASIRDFNRAIRLDGTAAPFVDRLAGIGCAHFIAGRYADAAPWFRRALAANPAATVHYRQLAATYALMGEKRSARTALDALRRAYPGATLASFASIISPGCREKTLEALSSIGLPP